ncbi:MAG: hypothetical protein E7013_00690 [Alphaproteobacteria bacterium]|nr:hypothetical protein [Alphaproteobacteria bacterium]
MNADVKVILSDDERQPVECWTRVMGYFRPVSQFNNGKQSEYAERKWFTESKAFASEKCACVVGK